MSGKYGPIPIAIQNIHLVYLHQKDCCNASLSLQDSDASLGMEEFSAIKPHSAPLLQDKIIQTTILLFY